MKNTLVVFALSLACLSSSTASDKPQAGPETMLEAWASAWRTGDADRMLTFYEQSKDVVAIASSGRRYDGAEGVRKMYEEAFGEADWQRVELRGVKLSRDGDIAWATCRFQAEIVVQPNNATLVFTSQGSLLLRRTADQWRIVLEHFSPIADVPRIRPRE